MDSKLRDQIEVHTSEHAFANKGKREKEDEEEKKRKARARQAAILQQMKSRQAAFESQLQMAEDEMDELDETAHTAAIPTNTTSDGEVVSSTCALCREGGNLTARPLGHVAFVQRSVVLALAKWPADVRRARIEALIAPKAPAAPAATTDAAGTPTAPAEGTEAVADARTLGSVFGNND